MPLDNRQAQRILIVDDEPNTLRLLIEHLAGHGFEILISEDGESGLRRARYALPDLILLDVILPDVDGFELCHQFKTDEQTAPIPVIFMTVLALPEDKTRGFALGGADYVTKPLQWEEVLARVTLQLRLRELAQRLHVAEDALAALADLEEENCQLRRQNDSLAQEVLSLRQQHHTL